MADITIENKTYADFEATYPPGMTRITVIFKFETTVNGAVVNYYLNRTEDLEKGIISDLLTYPQEFIDEHGGPIFSSFNFSQSTFRKRIELGEDQFEEYRYTLSE